MKTVLSLLFIVASLVQVVLGQYKLKDNYTGKKFLEQFTFFHERDPTNGFVQYQDLQHAKSLGLAFVKGNRFIMKADNKTIAPHGRPSIRIHSNKTYSSGLFVFDINHIPSGCGTWPAFWLLGQTWPNNGEIDIIEGIHNETKNTITLHTDNKCSMQGVKQFMTGAASKYRNCDVHAADQPNNHGCSVSDSKHDSVGRGFNKNGGGVYAVRWERLTGIQIWFFPRRSIPKDIKSGKPTLKNWGRPTADFPFGNRCQHEAFKNMRIVLDLTFCGDLAGIPSISSSYHCPLDCKSYVKNNPHSFNAAFWDINSLKVYQK
ncbi:hypothetical protein CU097_006589 [Rhizopus azygosporus]|uniref:GH16 domain-containing protein n=2 Tax=Rhizopus TaxID=4842 RepID=A0A367K0P7_RHIAZ|nr:hypothetical protein CU097_006589 [Rhizopus azygosporus]CEJ03802.1 hypothetical protein RMCBS344292_17779 [Rhizopus microsporus]